MPHSLRRLSHLCSPAPFLLTELRAGSDQWFLSYRCPLFSQGFISVTSRQSSLFGCSLRCLNLLWVILWFISVAFICFFFVLQFIFSFGMKENQNYVTTSQCSSTLELSCRCELVVPAARTETRIGLSLRTWTCCRKAALYMSHMDQKAGGFIKKAVNDDRKRLISQSDHEESHSGSHNHKDNQNCDFY